MSGRQRQKCKDTKSRMIYIAQTRVIRQRNAEIREIISYHRRISNSRLILLKKVDKESMAYILLEIQDYAEGRKMRATLSAKALKISHSSEYEDGPDENEWLLY